MKIRIFNNYGIVNFDFQKIVNDIATLFTNSEGINKNLSLILIDNKEIHIMNMQYRKRDYPTDVLSFPDCNEEYLGDIFISIDKVNEQAQKYNHSLEREFAFLLTHGILHLLGYDHVKEEDEKIMFNKQETLLQNTDYRRD